MNSGHRTASSDATIDPAGFWLQLAGSLAATLESVVPAESQIVYFDYPVHSNVGDMLIFLGTEEWIKKSAIRVSGRYPLNTWPPFAIDQNVVLVCHGGGNFGDLYAHQRFREEIVRRYPANRIVFLPQTLYYQSEAALARSAVNLCRHDHLTMIFRDTVSLETAEDAFPDADLRLAPDMATFLYPLEKTLGLIEDALLQKRPLYLLRKDREAVESQILPEMDGGWQGDWRDMLGHRVMAIHAFRLARGLAGNAMVSASYFAAWRWFVEKLVRHCAKYFLQADHVITSRLHGHIFASLLGVPNTILDNNYKKNSHYFNTWHKNLEITKLFIEQEPHE
jgi:pyruvyl transferase EpsO